MRISDWSSDVCSSDLGGDEDGVANEINDQLYTTPEDALATVAALGAGEKGRYMTALTFGNVHGVYKPGNVKLRPEILRTAQDAVASQLGLDRKSTRLNSSH